MQTTPRITRRALLGRSLAGLGGLVVGVPLLAGCQAATTPAATPAPAKPAAAPSPAGPMASPTAQPSPAASPIPAASSAPAASPAASPVVQQAAPASAAAGAPRRGGQLRLSLAAEVQNLDPHTSATTDDTHVQRAVCDPLFDLNEKLEPVPVLAEGVEFSGPTTMLLKLRRGILFHDGSPVDAEAVKWNLDRHLDPATKSLSRSLLASLKSVDVADAHTVRLTLVEADPALVSILANSAASRITSKAHFEKVGADGIRRHPVGAGPFMFGEWVPGQRVVLRRNPRYWQPDRPYLDEIVVRSVPEAGAKQTELRTGATDFIDDVLARDALAMKNDPSMVVSMMPGIGYTRIELNHAKPPFDTKALRQAFAAAVHRSAIDRVVFQGSGAVAQGPIPPTSWAFDPELKGWGPVANVELAKQKLAEGGQPNGFAFSMDNQTITQRGQIAQLLQEQVRQVGMELEILTLEVAPYSSRRTSGEYTSRLGTWPGRADPVGNMYSHFVTKGANNFGPYSNPELDRLLERGRTSQDRVARIAAFQAAQRILADDVPVVFLYHEPWVRAWTARLRGYQPVADGLLRFGDAWLQP